MERNVAGQVIRAQMALLSGGTAYTGSGATCYIANGSGIMTLGSVGSGVCTHIGNGGHAYSPSQAETDYALVTAQILAPGCGTIMLQFPTTTSQMAGFKKNTAFYLPFTMVDETDLSTLEPGKTVTVELSADSANTLTAATNSAFEVAASGRYKVLITAAEANVGTLLVSLSAVGCATRTISIKFSE